MAQAEVRQVQSRTRRSFRVVDERGIIDLRLWLGMTLVADALCAIVAAVLALGARFGSFGGPYFYIILAALLPLIWLGILSLRGAYDRRQLAVGAEPFRRVLESGLILLGSVAIISFLLHADLSRGFMAIAAGVVTPLTMLSRYAGRKRLHATIGRGARIHDVVVAGSAREVDRVVSHMRRAPYAGFNVVCVCPLDLDRHPDYQPPPGVDMVRAQVDDLATTVLAMGADTLAIAGTSQFATGALRRLSWKLESAPVQLVVAPSVTDFAGPRIVVRPVDGLPLLHIDEPNFGGLRRLVKEVLDRTMAFVLVLVFAPVMLVIAALIKLDDGGPVFFKQNRVGRHGRSFQIWKFRTMVVDAERRLADLAVRNDHQDGVLFKIRQDPRITRTGAGLRRHSLDELPQLFNVITGQMSLVGPRPPLPAEVAKYGDDMRRRLLVKPGMTGLWQINGRSDIPWQETVRLDLHYVENWTPALDLMVLWKTLGVVLRGHGGY